MTTDLPPPGWHHAQGDPDGTERYWDGTAWTGQVRQSTPTPPPPPSAPGTSGSQFGDKAGHGQASHEIDYEVHGDDIQFVEVELDPGETVIGEAGTMMMMDDGVAFQTKMGDGSDPGGGLLKKLAGAAGRVITGESVFLTHFTNTGQGKRKVSFAAPYPGRIVPIDLTDVGGRLIAQKDAFLCAAYGTRVSIAFNRKLGAGLFGGEGFILQDLQGDGNAFLHAGGSIVVRELRDETLRLDTGCLVALEPQLSYDIERAGNLKSMVFGGEGLFLATIRGTGRVWVQSLPFARLAGRIAQSVTTGKSDGEASLAGGLSTLFENR